MDRIKMTASISIRVNPERAVCLQNVRNFMADLGTVRTGGGRRLLRPAYDFDVVDSHLDTPSGFAFNKEAHGQVRGGLANTAHRNIFQNGSAADKNIDRGCGVGATSLNAQPDDLTSRKWKPNDILRALVGAPIADDVGL